MQDLHAIFATSKYTPTVIRSLSLGPDRRIVRVYTDQPQLVPQHQSQARVRADPEQRRPPPLVEPPQALRVERLHEAVGQIAVEDSAPEGVRSLVVEPGGHDVERDHEDDGEAAAEHAGGERRPQSVLGEKLQTQ